MKTTLRIITCVTNGGGVGPGHTAISFNDTVYSFENAGDWFSIGGEGSGWKIFDLKKYIENNAARPVILQKINEQVDPAAALRFIHASIGDDDDYLSSGVCSSLVSSAINAGTTFEFNPSGVDTPHKVFHLARRKGIVASEEGFWAGRANMPVLRWADIVNKLSADYRGAPVPLDR